VPRILRSSNPQVMSWQGHTSALMLTIQIHSPHETLIWVKRRAPCQTSFSKSHCFQSSPSRCEGSSGLVFHCRSHRSHRLPCEIRLYGSHTAVFPRQKHHFVAQSWHCIIPSANSILNSLDILPLHSLFFESCDCLVGLLASSRRKLPHWILCSALCAI